MYRVPDAVDSPLHVVTAIFNPVRYKSRWKLYHRFAQHVADSGAVLHTIEASFGARRAAVAANPHHGQVSKQPDHVTQQPPHTYTQIQTSHELWLKENMLNLVIARLPSDWKYVAWVDADILFQRPNWVGETIHQLQHYQVVQMFSDAQDLSPTFEIMQRHKSFMSCYVQGIPEQGWQSRQGYYGHTHKGPVLWHPGFAWAARREAVDRLGGLFDVAILGAADNHMAHALIGRAQDSIHPKIHPAYRRHVMEWQNRAEKHVRRNVGYVSGTISHFWHGNKANRQYWDRWKILVDNQFNPDIDIKRDWQGLYQLVDRGTDRSRHLRDQLRGYFRVRNEDSIDM